MALKIRDEHDSTMPISRMHFDLVGKVYDKCGLPNAIKVLLLIIPHIGHYEAKTLILESFTKKPFGEPEEQPVSDLVKYAHMTVADYIAMKTKEEADEQDANYK